MPHDIPTMSAPQITERTTYTVTLAWDGINMNSDAEDDPIYYEVWWSSGFSFELLTETSRTEFVVNIPSHMYEYSFKIRPKDQCGEGDFSPILQVPTVSAPARPDPVIISL